MGRYPKPPKAKSPEELAAMAKELVGGYNDSLEDRAKSRPMSNYASQVGHPCTFFLWAKRHHWEKMPTPDTGLRNIFALGHEHEQAMKIRLLQDGWNVTKVETAFVDDEHNVHGYMDWELSHPTKPGWQYPVTIEMKSTAPTIFPTIHSFEGLFTHDKKWVCTTPYQVLSYAAMDTELRPQVGVVYRCKSTGAIKVLLANTADHVHRLGPVHERLDIVNAALESGVPPEPIEYERKWCERCDAASVCPNMQEFAGKVTVSLIPKPGTIDTICDTWDRCTEAKKTAVSAWDDLRDQLRHFGAWKDLEKGGTGRSLVGARWRYPVKVYKNGTEKLDTPVRITTEEEPSGR